MHPDENTDSSEPLHNILAAFLEVAEPIVFPVHPRTRQKLAELDHFITLQFAGCSVRLIDPVGYLDMVLLEQSARMILTDSGGIQKKVYWLSVSCVTLLDVRPMGGDCEGWVECIG